LQSDPPQLRAPRPADPLVLHALVTPIRDGLQPHYGTDLPAVLKRPRAEQFRFGCAYRMSSVPAGKNLAEIVVDCAAVVPSLSGSEFFGHEKGAFTGAVAAREGAFAMADGGTLFLDEVGELPPPLQAELLRVIQEGMYKRVGSNVWRRTNFRLLCATNRSLLDPDSESLFRRDLYHRIAAWTCHLPTLRDRVDDIPILSRHFLRLASPGEEEMELDEPVARFLAERAYPGNVRDLKNLVFRIRSRHVGPGPITVGDIPPEERPCAAHEEGTWDEQGFEQCIRRALTRGVTLREIRNAAGEIAVRIAFAEEKGNLQQAARRLGITNRALQMRRAARREEVH